MRAREPPVCAGVGSSSAATGSRPPPARAVPPAPRLATPRSLPNGQCSITSCTAPSRRSSLATTSRPVARHGGLRQSSGAASSQTRASTGSRARANVAWGVNGRNSEERPSAATRSARRATTACAHAPAGPSDPHPRGVRERAHAFEVHVEDTRARRDRARPPPRLGERVVVEVAQEHKRHVRLRKRRPPAPARPQGQRGSELGEGSSRSAGSGSARKVRFRPPSPQHDARATGGCIGASAPPHHARHPLLLRGTCMGLLQGGVAAPERRFPVDALGVRRRSRPESGAAQHRDPAGTIHHFYVPRPHRLLEATAIGGRNIPGPDPIGGARAGRGCAR